VQKNLPTSQYELGIKCPPHAEGLRVLCSVPISRFSPEMLGIHASSALAWSVIEIIVELVTLYITNIQTNLKTLDLLAYGGYKYVG
jgi:hypothetical protein